MKKKQNYTALNVVYVSADFATTIIEVRQPVECTCLMKNYIVSVVLFSTNTGISTENFII